MQNENKMKKSTKYLLIGTLVLFLSVLGASMAYYLARVQGSLNGRAAGTDLDIEVTKLSNNATGDLIPLDNDIETLNLAAVGYQDKGSCVDINGYSVCQIYKITLTNNGSIDLKMNGTVTLSGQNTPNIDCATMTNATTVANNNSCMGINNFVSGDTLAANSHNDYYVMVYINNLDEPQTDSGEFNGTVEFTSVQGKQVKARFRNEEVLADYITNLYTTKKDTTVTNNEIEYQYATSVNLMNDRLGGTTTDLDGGNIRYYGAEPNNYIDIGDRTLDNQIILWRIIGVFDGKVRIIRNESIGDYSFDTSASDVNDGWGINEWSQADIMKLLNPGYAMEIVGGSLWYNSEKGTCYNGLGNAKTECDFTNSGLSNSVKSKVIDQTVYLGGGSNEYIYVNQAYSLERGSDIIQKPSDGVTRTLTWTGKVGLMYPSDYGYAVDFNSCSKKLYNYYDTTCKDSNWIFNENTQYVITPKSSSNTTGWFIKKNGEVLSSVALFGPNGIRPVLTLTSEVIIESEGKGTIQSPYILKF